MARNRPVANSGMGFGRLLLFITLLSVIGIILFNYYKNNVQNYQSVPSEMQVTYVPSDFEFELDDENTLAILSNPHRYRREFNDLVYNFNLSLLDHVANRMDIADSLKAQIATEYDKHHHYLKQLYFNDFIQLKDTTSNLYQAWYDNESTNAVDVLTEVSSKYTCFLVNHVIMTLVASENGTLNVKGNKVATPCGIAMTEALRPMLKRLQDKAAIIDFSRSKGMMEERVEKVIAELATMEVRDKKGLTKQLQTKVWGYAVSSSDIDVSAISILKVGFKLDQYFNIDVNEKRKTVEINLPEPTILSHEVYPKIDKLDIGWLREVKNLDINDNFNILRGEFRRDAFDSDIMEKSKAQAKELMDMLFSPLANAISKEYRLKVRFHNPARASDSEFIGSGINKKAASASLNIEDNQLTDE